MRQIGKSTLLCLGLILSHMRAAGQNNDPVDWQRRVLNHIVELRADLMECLLDAQDRKVKDLARELDEVRHNQTRLQQEETERQQQITQVDEQLTNAQLELSARSQLEAWRVHLATERAEQWRTEQAGSAQREGQVLQQLDREMQHTRKLQERARQLQAALIRP